MRKGSLTFPKRELALKRKALSYIYLNLLGGKGLGSNQTPGGCNSILTVILGCGRSYCAIFCKRFPQPPEGKTALDKPGGQMKPGPPHAY